MKKLIPVSILCLAATLTLASWCMAGIRSPGKYAGVVVFDRWDGCTFYSGTYVMYVSEKVKEQLRPYADKAVLIDAKDVWQPINPGDGLICKLEYLGSAPEEKRHWVDMKGIHMAASVKAGKDGKPVGTITVKNTGKEPLKVRSGEIALAVLTTFGSDKKGVRSFTPSDGPSFALITRVNFENLDGTPRSTTRWRGGGARSARSYAWTLGKENALPTDFTLAPGEKREIDVQFDLPDGQYDFLCGYGGQVHATRCTASNLAAFDVKDGKVKIVKTKRK